MKANDVTPRAYNIGPQDVTTTGPLPRQSREARTRRTRVPDDHDRSHLKNPLNAVVRFFLHLTKFSGTASIRK
jgi:hypothetical protein